MFAKFSVFVLFVAATLSNAAHVDIEKRQSK